jgi:hypothetical protein
MPEDDDARAVMMAAMRSVFGKDMQLEMTPSGVRMNGNLFAGSGVYQRAPFPFLSFSSFEPENAAAPAKMVALRGEAEGLVKKGEADGALAKYRAAMAELVGHDFAHEILPWTAQRTAHGYRAERIVRLNDMDRFELMGLCLGAGDCMLKKGDRVMVSGSFMRRVYCVHSITRFAGARLVLGCVDVQCARRM